MATCLDVITSAMKLAKILPSGGTPSAAETSDGLACLQSLYDEWRVGGMFGQLEDVYMTEDDTAEEGKRYYVPAGITLTAATSEYVDSYGDTRQPRDLSMYESLTSTGTHTVKLYDRTAWVDLLGLTSGDSAPLSNRGSMGLAACLALSGAFISMFGGSVDQPMVMLAGQFLKGLSNKVGSTQDDPGQDFY
jgi:hypothetical protein